MRFVSLPTSTYGAVVISDGRGVVQKAETRDVAWIVGLDWPLGAVLCML